MKRREFAYVSDGTIATARDKALALVGRSAGSRDFHLAIAAKFRDAGLLEMTEAEIRAKPDRRAAPVVAFVNHGRWIAKCECGGNEVVDPEDPFFLCLSCFNEAEGGKIRRAIFPEDRTAIERALLERRDPRTRGWELGETADKLREQTAREERP